ncbi:MAG: hypothetical protein HRT55_12795 [Colwellia sp.]|nr:hypothetical protein [Colwellia sp.]MCJ8296362.1 hypothetical protein [Colwellia sp.]NQZ27176.1 hypothetical protein [Colwellia sp.]
MYSSPDKTKQELDTPAIIDEQEDKVMIVNYPLSFLLLESEEDSFVRGYN